MWYQNGNQKSNIEGQTKQWPNRKGKKNPNNGRQNTAKKNKDWATRTPLKIGGEFGCTGMEAAPTPLVAPIVLLLNDPNNI